jgi:hypothetical protein
VKFTAAVLPVALACSALALASPASAKTFTTHIAMDCPQPFSQQCNVKKTVSMPTEGPLFFSYTADPNPPSCAPGRAHLFLDGAEWAATTLQPGQNDGGFYADVSPGRHDISVQMEGVEGGCNTGAMSGWSGTLTIESDADAQNGAS